MKAVAIVLIVAAVLVASAATAGAVIGWCGNIWPVKGAGSHGFVIDDSGATMDLAPDSWEYQAADCPDCETPVEGSTWGTVKALHR